MRIKNRKEKHELENIIEKLTEEINNLKHKYLHI